MKETITPARSFGGTPVIPGDKSISHRALILGALAEGRTEITGLLDSDDVRSTIRCLRQLGVFIDGVGQKTWVEGLGSRKWVSPGAVLDCGNSGTTIRLLMGVLTGKEVGCILTGDESLRGRPMLRVADPLRKMGAEISLSKHHFAPVTLHGSTLRAMDYELPIASAQVKSALLLAGLSVSGTTVLRGKIASRDHTERMLPYFGAKVECAASEIRIEGKQQLKGTSVQVPGDPSTAAFWIAAACIVPGARLRLENISLNPTRLGFLHALQAMGADIRTRIVSNDPEPVGEVEVVYSKLNGICISESMIPSLIDEIPLLAIVGTQAEGSTEVMGAQELKVKESDRLAAICEQLKIMGVEIERREDGFRVIGRQKLRGATIQSAQDHRIAMAFSIAALVAEGTTEILDAECVSVSYPGFYTTLRDLTHHIAWA